MPDRITCPVLAARPHARRTRHLLEEALGRHVSDLRDGRM